MPAPRPRRRRALMIAVTLSIALALGLGIAEAVVRALGTTDADGDFIFRGHVLPPAHMPVRAVREALARIAGERRYIVYDATCGWTIAPDARSDDGLYASNGLGIRSDREDAVTPTAGRMRVVLLGDSFTHGDEVPFEGTVGKQLENAFWYDGVDAEVLDLGVPGYGFDQIYLRWKSLGARLGARVVVLGLCVGDAERVVNVQRWFLDRANFYTKPRFTLDGRGALVLRNVPTIPPDEIAASLENFPASDLAPLERHYFPEEFETSPLFSSKLAALLAYKWRPNYHVERIDPLLLPDGEAGALSLALIAALKKDVEATGARFLVVHLPWRHEMRAAAEARGADVRGPLMRRLQETTPVIETQQALLDAAPGGDVERLFCPSGHLGGTANARVAAEVARAIEGK